MFETNISYAVMTLTMETIRNDEYNRVINNFVKEFYEIEKMI